MTIKSTKNNQIFSQNNHKEGKITTTVATKEETKVFTRNGHFLDLIS